MRQARRQAEVTQQKMQKERRIRKAQQYLAQAQRADRIGPTKQMLAACRGYSEDKAHRYIRQYARNHGCSPQQAAERILAILKEEEAGRAAQTL